MRQEVGGWVVECEDSIYKYFEDYIRGMIGVMKSPRGRLVISVSAPVMGSTHVLINTEQLSRCHYREVVSRCLGAGMLVIDYSLENIRIMGDHPNHLWFPHPFEVMRASTDTIRTKTVCMIGATRSIRRTRIFDALVGHGIEGVWGWGDERDRSIMDFRVVVNVHFDEDYVVHEHLRCDRCVMNGLIVVSEDGIHNDLVPFGHHMLLTPYAQIVATVVDVLGRYDDWRERLLPVCPECIRRVGEAHDHVLDRLEGASVV